MQLYNSLTARLEPFELKGDPLTMYVCGITPYDTTHLGHAFTAVVADILVRFLEYRGQRVRYVQNVTDIDDDILRVAAATGEDWRALGNRWTRHYIEDMQSLGIRPPDRYARATEVIPEIIRGVKQLLEVGVAYEAGGSVYFAVESWKAFGSLSKLDRGSMLPIANERGNNPDDPHKRDPLDFVLWQAASSGEPAWQSPWGPGRPGWHMECTTMIRQHLGATIDLHAGGADLIFPHHECEIAQAEPVSGAPFVRHWMHIAMVEHRGEKMSKSLGNLVMVRDLLERWTPDAIRLYLATQHYRSPWSLDERALDQAQTRAEQLAGSVEPRSAGGQGDMNGPGLRLMASEGPETDDATGMTAAGSKAVRDFERALSDDLNSPEAVEILLRFAEKIHSGGAGSGADRIALGEMARVLGLQFRDGESGNAADWSSILQQFAED